MTEENFEELRKDLRQFEKELPSPSQDSLSSFADALRRIWQYLRREEISNEESDQLRRLRYTYVRRFLEAVPQMPPFYEETWYAIYCFLDLVNEDLERLLTDYPELEPGRDIFGDATDSSTTNNWIDPTLTADYSYRTWFGT